MEKEQHLTIDGKMMLCFFSEIVFILLLNKINNSQFFAQSIDMTDFLSSIRRLSDDTRHENKTDVFYRSGKSISDDRYSLDPFVKQLIVFE